MTKVASASFGGAGVGIEGDRADHTGGPAAGFETEAALASLLSPSLGFDHVVDSVDERRAADALRHSVTMLDWQLQQVLLWHVNEGLTYRDIARRLGVSPPEALRHLAHAYASLDDLMRARRG